MDAAQKAKTLAQQAVDKYTRSGQEPVSGETGQGTKTQPFDGGNQEEQKDGPKDVAEPKAGIQGAGTKSEPFDQGNVGAEQPDQSA